jgi:tellurite resistance protein TerC
MMDIQSVASPQLWLAFGVFVALMLALDLGVFHRKAHVVSIREAAIWSGVWVALALAFNGYIFLRFGRTAGEAFLTGYLIEKALSVDNLFVFYVVFSAFGVAAAYQHRLLFWGILGALLFRGLMVFGGVALLTRFHWLVYVFGVLLIFTGAKMLFRPGHDPRPEQSRAFRFVQRIIPTSQGEHGGRIFVREQGRWLATSLFLVLVLVELSDVVFAVDSILAIFAITMDPFIVLTSNVFAILGLRSLYFVLASVANRFVYLQPGLALILVFVGIKMAISEWFKLPMVASLLVVATLLIGSIVASLVHERRARRKAAQGAALSSRPRASARSQVRM